MSEPEDDEIDAILREVRSVDVPEPSPLFWNHFRARVNAAIDTAPAPRHWWHSPAFRWAAAAAAIIGVVASFSVLRAPERQETTVRDSTPVADLASMIETPEIDADIDNDEAWAVVRSYAEELEYDDAREAGVLPRPGSVERAATELSTDERAELVRLIENELKRTGA